MIRTLPLRLRNRLAATIVDAVSDAGPRHTLAAVAAAPHTWLAADEAEWATLLATRARRAYEALVPLPAATLEGLDAALDAAARLYDAGLYFEVHEWLEPRWMAASGETRDALQGLIQAAVGWQHLANDNVAGARSLLGEAAIRLRGRRLGTRDFDAFARATAVAASGVPSAMPPPFPAARCDTTDRDREESV